MHLKTKIELIFTPFTFHFHSLSEGLRKWQKKCGQSQLKAKTKNIQETAPFYYNVRQRQKKSRQIKRKKRTIREIVLVLSVESHAHTHIYV